MMRKLLWGIVLWPVGVVGGWLATKLSERYEVLDYEFGFDD